MTHSVESRADFDAGERKFYLSTLCACLFVSAYGFFISANVAAAPLFFMLGALLSLSAPPFYFSLLRLLFFSEFRSYMLAAGAAAKIMSLSLFFFGPQSQGSAEQLWAYLLGASAMPLGVILLVFTPQVGASRRTNH